ncbi:MAG: helix-turn-helix domain-containing protein [Pirellulales bacterium]
MIQQHNARLANDEPNTSTLPAELKVANTVPMLLNASHAAQFCGVSQRTWRRWDASGAMPQAITVGFSSKRWRRFELEAWIEAGCPPRVEWEQRTLQAHQQKNNEQRRRRGR